MKTSILIVTHEKDFEWLKYCLRSIEKFTTGFHEVVICVPSHSTMRVDIIIDAHREKVPLRLHLFDEWKDKGFVHHMAMIMAADTICPTADYILHMDADCIFSTEARPEDYLVGDRPILCKARYDWVVARFANPQHYKWREAVQKAIGGKSEFEFMRRHPAVHHVATYREAKRQIEGHVRRSMFDYIRSTQNTFPHGFCEFCTLGEVAWRHFRDRYFWIDQETDPWPIDRMLQFWSHSPLDRPNNVWLGGRLVEMVPNEVFKRLLE